VADDLLACLDRHAETARSHRCRRDGQPWPCDAARAAERIRDLEQVTAERDALAAAQQRVRELAQVAGRTHGRGWSLDPGDLLATLDPAGQPTTDQQH
jgi:hypothetical protein